MPGMMGLDSTRHMCHAPAGRFEGTYDEIRAQFGPYYWRYGSRLDDDPDKACPRLDPP